MVGKYGYLPDNKTRSGFSANITARVTTLTNFIHFPPVIYQNITASLLFNKTYYVINNYILSDCNASNYQSLYLRFDDFWLEVKPETFLLNKTINTSTSSSTTGSGQSNQNNPYSNLCTLAIMPSTDNVLLGISFLRNYYVIFDLQNDQLGIYQSSYVTASYFAGPPVESIKLPA